MIRWLTGSALIPLARQGGEPGKEIRYPVATTAIGGLIAGALLDFCVAPTVFLRFGRGAVPRDR